MKKFILFILFFNGISQMAFAGDCSAMICVCPGGYQIQFGQSCPPVYSVPDYTDIARKNWSYYSDRTPRDIPEIVKAARSIGYDFTEAGNIYEIPEGVGKLFSSKKGRQKMADKSGQQGLIYGGFTPQAMQLQAEYTAAKGKKIAPPQTASDKSLNFQNKERMRQLVIEHCGLSLTECTCRADALAQIFNAKEWNIFAGSLKLSSYPEATDAELTQFMAKLEPVLNQCKLPKKGERVDPKQTRQVMLASCNSGDNNNCECLATFFEKNIKTGKELSILIAVTAKTLEADRELANTITDKDNENFIKLIQKAKATCKK